jgi:hypothetical protein
MSDKITPPALAGQECKDGSGNRYKIISHYGGAGTPVPEMVNLLLIKPAVFRANRPQHWVGGLDRSVFDEAFTVVKPER